MSGWKIWTCLEPLLATAVAALVVASTLVHPDHDGTLLVRPLGPDGLDLSTRSDFGNEISRRAAVAHDLLVGDGHSGVVVGPLALDSLRRRRGREAGISWR
jgi:hypothetical protein